IVSLVERAAETIDAQKAMKIAEKMKKGKFDLDDLSDQLAQMEKLGGLGGIMGMLPGMGKMKDQLAQAGMNDGMIKRQRAIISSMTPAERRNPDLLKNSRKKRVAAGSGTKAEEINRLLKQHRQMADMMKMMGGAKKGALGKMASMFGMGGNPLGGNPMAGMPQPTPEQLEEMGRRLGAGQNPGLPSMPDFGKMPKLPPNVPGLGGPRLPGLGGGGFPFGGKKK
ncbi:MAG: signal recognition particle protein, partial [Methylobacterium mesophilicum]|nr:signal recognition particle protein [Methylobacterium mesophilicum]